MASNVEERHANPVTLPTITTKAVVHFDRLCLPIVNTEMFKSALEVL